MLAACVRGSLSLSLSHSSCLMSKRVLLVCTDGQTGQWMTHADAAYHAIHLFPLSLSFSFSFCRRESDLTEWVYAQELEVDTLIWLHSRHSGHWTLQSWVLAHVEPLLLCMHFSPGLNCPNGMEGRTRQKERRRKRKREYKDQRRGREECHLTDFGPFGV